MHETIYSLSLSRTDDGHFVKSAPSGSFGLLDPLPLGNPYSDVFRKNRAPSPREMIQQLVGTAYACASLNADLVASTRLVASTVCELRPGDALRWSCYIFLHPRRFSAQTLSAFEG